MKITVRTENPADYRDVFRINALAFERDNESRLVDTLRNDNGFIPALSLLAEANSNPVGHILFLPIKIKSSNTEYETLSLAPLSVLPPYQNKGIGSQLVKSGLAAAQQEGFSSVIVVGHPEFYPRFGFQPASKWNIKAPFEMPDNVFMAIELEAGVLNKIEGVVVFPFAYNICMD